MLNQIKLQSAWLRQRARYIECQPGWWGTSGRGKRDQRVDDGQELQVHHHAERYGNHPRAIRFRQEGSRGTHAPGTALQVADRLKLRRVNGSFVVDDYPAVRHRDLDAFLTCGCTCIILPISN
jgi:hypothetical protein